MDKRTPKLIDQSVFTPEETALMMRLRIFINLRWLAVVAIVITATLASQVFGICVPYVASLCNLPVHIAL